MPTRRESHAALGLPGWEDWMESAGWWVDSLMGALAEGRAQGKERYEFFFPGSESPRRGATGRRSDTYSASPCGRAVTLR